MSLLRELDNNGIAVSDLYDPDIVLDVKKRELQEEWLDTHSLTDIANIIDDSNNAMTPMQFKVYDPYDDNRVEGIGVIVKKNIEVKIKGIVQDNKTVQFETNFCDPIEVVYVKEHIDLSTQ